jgi:hypothetical protein
MSMPFHRGSIYPRPIDTYIAILVLYGTLFSKSYIRGGIAEFNDGQSGRCFLLAGLGHGMRISLIHNP